MSPLEAREDARDELLRAARAELIGRGASAIGLRAVARRAGLSHAAPGYFFGDRTGMLTALAAQGWGELATALERVAVAPSETRLSRLGDAYIEFGLRHAALYELMSSGAALRREDTDLQAAQRRALAPLLNATGAGDETSADALMSWALVHGLVSLARQGALPVPDGEVVPTLSAVTRRFAVRASHCPPPSPPP